MSLKSIISHIQPHSTHIWFASLFGAAILATVAFGAGLPAPPAHQAAQDHGQSARQSDVYALDTCPVTGEKLGSMGDPVVKTIDGREVRFCCDKCISKFEADKASYWKKIDAAIIKEQLPFYPLTTCPISGDKLNGDMGKPVDYVYQNRLIRFCCPMCIPKFLKDPEPTLKKLDEAVIRQQMDRYPLKVCMVSGDDLAGGDMGAPVNKVIDNHLVRFCCNKCVSSFEKHPAKFMAMLDDAWKKQGGPIGAAIEAQQQQQQQQDHH